MHYFRFMRSGSYELAPKTRKLRRQDPRGYWKLYLPDHPLADSTGFVWEHRKIVHDRIGNAVPPCELCYKPLSWETAHVDHIDDNPANNDPKNLRPLCNVCNTRRPVRIQHEIKGHYAITFDGETKTPTEWARDPRVNVSRRAITARKKQGASDFDALFGPKKTHRAKVRRMKPIAANSA